MAALQVDLEPEAVLANRDPRRLALPAQRGDHGSQSFQRPHFGIRALPDARCAARFDQLVGDNVTPALRTGARQLQHHGIGVTVSHNARQPVRLAMNQPNCIGIVPIQQRPPLFDRPPDDLAEERAVYGAIFPVPDAGHDL